MSFLCTLRSAVNKTARKTPTLSRLGVTVVPARKYICMACGKKNTEPPPQHNRNRYYLAATIGVALIAAEYVYNGT